MKQIFTLAILFSYFLLNAQEATFDTPILLFDHPQGDNVLLGEGVVPLDYNQVGILDFAVKGDGQWLYEGGEDLTYTKIDVGSNTLSRSVFATVDFDDDGDMDIVTKAYLLINEGNGDFSELSIGLVAFESDVIVAIADVDGDADLDFFVKKPTSFDGDGLSVIINEGNGEFTRMDLPVLEDTNFGAVDVGDIDGDGDVDVVIAMNFESDEVVLYWNDGAGNYTMDVTPIADEIESNSIELKDMDNDGDLEIVAIGYNEIRIYENVDNFETFSSNSKYVNDVIMFRTADVNKDGQLDILVVRHDQSDLVIGILENKGSLTFSNSTDIHSFPASNFVSYGEESYLKHSLQAIDIDKDGTKDLLFTDGYSEPNSVVYLKGTGTFVATNEVEIDDISILPNPTTNFLQVNDERLKRKNTTYTIVNSTGLTLQTGVLKDQIDVSNLISGLYIIILDAEEISYRGTFSKM